MVRPLLFVIGGALALATSLGVGDAAQVNANARHHTPGTGSRQQVNWKQRDTAVYVVSTLNLLRTSRGHPFSRLCARRLEVSLYEVYADAAVSDLYFIQLRRQDGSLAGGLAYQMGWAKPESVTAGLDGYGITPAPDHLVQAYKSDHLTLIGSFSSTLPQ